MNMLTNYGAVGLSFGSAFTFRKPMPTGKFITSIPREINKVAHTLAKVALANSVTQSWTSENPPACIVDLLSAEYVT